MLVRLSRLKEQTSAGLVCGCGLLRALQTQTCLLLSPYMPAGAPALVNSVRTARTRAKQTIFLQMSTGRCISLSWVIPFRKVLPLADVCKHEKVLHLASRHGSLPGRGEVLRKRRNWEVLWIQMLHTSSWEVQELNMEL